MDFINSTKLKPRVGDVWVYHDKGGKKTEWKVLLPDTDDPNYVKLRKETGVDAGYITLYPIASMLDGPQTLDGQAQWSRKSGAMPKVSFPCPSCHKQEPIYVGDYMCVQCRRTLDKNPESR